MVITIFVPIGWVFLPILCFYEIFLGSLRGNSIEFCLANYSLGTECPILIPDSESYCLASYLTNSASVFSSIKW